MLMNRIVFRIVAHSSVGKLDGLLNSTLRSNITYLVWGPPGSLKPHQGSITRWATKALKKFEPKPIIYVTFENQNRTTNYFDTVWMLENNRSRDDMKTWLSTGFFSVVTALNFCDSLTIFGLDAQNSCSSNSTKHIKVSFCQIKFDKPWISKPSFSTAKKQFKV